MPQDEMDMPEEQRPDNQPDWHEIFGDRKQLLVFIGQEMDEKSMLQSLDACLVEESLANQGIDAWPEFENPFPTIQMTDAEETE